MVLVTERWNYLGPGQESQTMPLGEKGCWREARARERPWEGAGVS